MAEEEIEIIRLLGDVLEELKWQSKVLEKLLDQRAISLNRNKTDLDQESVPSSEGEEASPEPEPAPHDDDERPIQPSFFFDRDEEEDRF